MNLLITICARGGSKGIPGKNIKPINGKPLIAYTIDTASKIAALYPGTDIGLSTDSAEIRQVAAHCGLSSDYERPESLASDTAGKVDAIRDIVTQMEVKHNKQYDYVLDLDVTSPLRTVEDIVNALNMMKEDAQALNIFSVSPANRNPYFNMVEQKENGYFAQVKKLEDTFMTRQAAPRVYDMNASFYIYSKAFFKSDSKGAITDKSLVYVMDHICFDLDHPVDYEMLSYLMKENLTGIEL